MNGRAAGGGARTAWLAAAVVQLCVLAAPAALAQHDGAAGSAPPPPPGPGQLTVEVVAAEGATTLESLSGLSIALYSLAPDGTPGLTNGVTDAQGRVTFEGISNDPAIVYLVGARYAEIPFGERVRFDDGESVARVRIEVAAPTDRVADVRVDELRVRLDWLGDRIVVTEIQRIANDGSRVIQLRGGASDSREDAANGDADGRTRRSITRRPLPAGASDFAPGPNSIGDGLALEDDAIVFWGPLYPGDQRIEYRYALPASAADGRSLKLPVQLREGTNRLVVVAGTAGIEVAGPQLVASRALAGEAADTGAESLVSWARSAVAPGERIDLGLSLPQTRRDPSLVEIPRADVWLDLDDTRLHARVELQLAVASGPPVAGLPERPLLRISLPPGAELEGVAPETESLGLVPSAAGGFDVLGPIGAGEHAIAYSYRLPSGPAGVPLAMRFPREVATLNVLIADSQLALESDRLHRRRPFRNGTRNFLHREAFNVSPDEIVDLELTPLRARGLPQAAAIGLVVVGVAAAAFYLVAPLRSARRRAPAPDSERTRLRDEREAAYTAIADLDHDYETGKLDERDYQEMRDALRTRAIELLRAEQLGQGEPATASASTPTTTPPERSTTQRRFCTGCGERIDAGWRFCSHCGEALAPAAPAPGRTAASDANTPGHEP